MLLLHGVTADRSVRCGSFDFWGCVAFVFMTLEQAHVCIVYRHRIANY